MQRMNCVLNRLQLIPPFHEQYGDRLGGYKLSPIECIYNLYICCISMYTVDSRGTIRRFLYCRRVCPHQVLIWYIRLNMIRKIHKIRTLVILYCIRLIVCWSNHGRYMRPICLISQTSSFYQIALCIRLPSVCTNNDDITRLSMTQRGTLITISYSCSLRGVVMAYTLWFSRYRSIPLMYASMVSSLDYNIGR